MVHVGDFVSPGSGQGPAGEIVRLTGRGLACETLGKVVTGMNAWSVHACLQVSYAT
jgi:hypothetical protein